MPSFKRLNLRAWPSFCFRACAGLAHLFAENLHPSAQSLYLRYSALGLARIIVCAILFLLAKKVKWFFCLKIFRLPQGGIPSIP